MRHRLLLALLSFALAAAACGQGAGTTGDTITLRYAYQPGDSLTYALTQQMTMAMTMTGAGDIGTPGTPDMNMDMDLVSRLEYEIDEDTMEVRQIWEYGENITDRIFTGRWGDADRLAQTGNVLLTFGAVSHVGGVSSSDLGLAPDDVCFLGEEQTENAALAQVRSQ